MTSECRLYAAIKEAGELSSREQELGAHGSVVVEAWVDGRPTGSVTPARPSFPRPSWGGFLLALPGATEGSQISLVVVDYDPLQPRTVERWAGNAFCFGRVDVQVSGASGADGKVLHDGAVALAEAPGSQGFLSFQLIWSPRGPPLGPRGGQTGERDLRVPKPGQGDDLCGVLGIACGHGGYGSERFRYEVSVGACVFRTWNFTGAGGVRWLFVCDNRPVLRVHASGEDVRHAPPLVAAGEAHITASPFAGAGAALLEPALAPLRLDWQGADAKERAEVEGHPCLEMHYRFFSAEFMRPGAYGIPVIRVALVVTSPGCPLPLAVFVPQALFGTDVRAAAATGEASLVEFSEDAGDDLEAPGPRRRELSFRLDSIGAVAAIPLPDALRLVGRSAWRVAPLGPTLDDEVDDEQKEADEPLHPEGLVDVFALQLRHGSDRTVTVTIGSYSAVLRFSLAMTDAQVPRPLRDGVGGAVSGSGGSLAAVAPLRRQSRGEVIGVRVHSFAVHSAAVSRCVLFAGPGAAGAVELGPPLPHRGQIFVAAEPSHRGRVVIHALLPEYNITATAAAVLGDGTQQLRWSFPSPAGEVHAGALVTAVRWPEAAYGSPVMPVQVQVRLSPADAAAEHVAPVAFHLGRGGRKHSLRWQGDESEPQKVPASEASEQDGFLPVSLFDDDFGTLEIRCGLSQLPVRLFLPDLLSAQPAHGEPRPLSVPVLVAPSPRDDDGERTSSKSSADKSDAKVEARLLFLPVVLRCRAGPPVGRQASLEDPDAGVMLLQSLSLSWAPDNHLHHKDCPKRRVSSAEGWMPSTQLALAVGRRSAIGGARAQHGCGDVFLWSPSAKSARFVDLLPFICSLPLAGCGLHHAGLDGICELPLRCELQLVCPGCGAVTSLLLSPREPPLLSELPAWRSVTLQLEAKVVEEDGSSDNIASAAIAFARVLICTSRFIREPAGFLSLTLRPLREGGAGVPELLRHESRVARAVAPGGGFAAGSSSSDGRGGPRPTALRLGIDGASSVLIEGGDNAGAASERLLFETTSRHLQRSATLELSEASGARAPLAAVALATLGNLGDRRTPVIFPLLMPGISLALVASYEPSGVVDGDSVAAPDVADGLAGPDAVTAAPAAEGEREKLLREIARLRRLGPTSAAPAAVPSSPTASAPARAARLAAGAAGTGSGAVASAGAAPKRVRPKSAGAAGSAAGAGATAGSRGRVRSVGATGGYRGAGQLGRQSHPYLERGPHHWLAPRMATNKSPEKHWAQEMERIRPATSSPAIATSAKAERAVVAADVPGYSDDLDSKGGPAYRMRLLDDQKRAVDELRSLLKAARAQAGRSEARLARARRLVKHAESHLGEPPQLRAPRQSAAGVRTPAAAASSSGAGDGASDGRQQQQQQYCGRCGCTPLATADLRFCGMCLPAVLQELEALQARAGKLLLQRARLRCEADQREVEACRLEDERYALEERAARAAEGIHDEEQRKTLRLITQVRSLMTGEKFWEASEADQLKLLEDREQEAKAHLEEATEDLAAADRRHAELTQELALANKDFEELTAIGLAGYGASRAKSSTSSTSRIVVEPALRSTIHVGEHMAKRSSPSAPAVRAAVHVPAKAASASAQAVPTKASSSGAKASAKAVAQVSTKAAASAGVVVQPSAKASAPPPAKAGAEPAVAVVAQPGVAKAGAQPKPSAKAPSSSASPKTTASAVAQPSSTLPKAAASAVTQPVATAKSGQPAPSVTRVVVTQPGAGAAQGAGRPDSAPTPKSRG